MRYFVAYSSLKNGITNLGNAEATTQYPIRSNEDIKFIAENIQRDGSCDKGSVIISGFQRFEEEDDWISVEERLPEDEVLFCNEFGEMMVGYIKPFETGFSCFDGSTELLNVTHWQPLPKKV